LFIVIVLSGSKGQLADLDVFTHLVVLERSTGIGILGFLIGLEL
jgi:hypothetical protein